MDKQLNEKLGRLAGVLVSIEQWPDELPTMNVYDAEQENLLEECEPFTESLDASFRIILPKLNGLKWTEVDFYSGPVTPHCILSGFCKDPIEKGADSYALAFCLAAEAAFDREVQCSLPA